MIGVNWTQYVEADCDDCGVTARFVAQTAEERFNDSIRSLMAETGETWMRP